MVLFLGYVGVCWLVRVLSSKEVVFVISVCVKVFPPYIIFVFCMRDVIS